MTWDAGIPDATKTAKDNRPGFTGNWDYIEQEIQDEHYFDESASKDGRHKQVSMENKASTPAIPADMDGILYNFENVSSQPFFKNSDSVMQLLGIRAMAEFNGSDGSLNYSYNVASIVRNNTGRYTVTYTTALPNVNYLVLGGAIRNDSDAKKELLFEVQANASNPPTTKAAATMKVMTKSDGGTFDDSRRAWFVCFGG